MNWKKYSPINQYKRANKLTILIDGMSDLVDRLYISELRFILDHFGFSKAGGKLLDDLSMMVSVGRGADIDDNKTRYVTTDGVQFIKPINQGKVYFDGVTDKEESGVVFFGLPIGDVSYWNDDRYRENLKMMSFMLYNNITHDKLIELLRLLSSVKDVKLTVTGKEIEVTYTGVVDTNTIALYTQKKVPLPMGRVIKKVYDNTGLIYEEPIN